MAFDPTHQRMYVVSFAHSTVAVIDTNINALIDTMIVGNAPSGIAFDPTHQRMYVSHRLDHSVRVIDKIGVGLQGLAFGLLESR